MLARITIAIGILLTAGGIWGYVGSGMKSLVALTPAAPAILLLICGLVALKKTKATNWLMAAQLIAFVTLVFCLPNVMKVGQLVDGSAARPTAVMLSIAFAGLLVIYLSFSVPGMITRKPVPRVHSVLPRG